MLASAGGDAFSAMALSFAAHWRCAVLVSNAHLSSLMSAPLQVVFKASRVEYSMQVLPQSNTIMHRVPTTISNSSWCMTDHRSPSGDSSSRVGTGPSKLRAAYMVWPCVAVPPIFGGTVLWRENTAGRWAACGMRKS